MKGFLTRSFVDTGLLVIRLGLGVQFILHGYPKIVGGPEVWTRLGGAMSNFGIDFAPGFWGFMAALAEFGGGILLLPGLLVRPAAILLAFTMLVASTFHLSNGDPFVQTTSRPLELLVVFVGLVCIGGGRFSLDKRLFGPAR